MAAEGFAGPLAGNDTTEGELGAQRPSCGLCDRETARAVCPGCELAVHDLMKELEQLVAHLSEHYIVPPKTGDSDGGAHGKPGSKPPLSIGVLSLLGPDCKTDHSPHGPIADQIGNRSILSVLSSWARDWHDMMPQVPIVVGGEYDTTQIDPPITRSVVSVLQFLVLHNSWAIDNYPGYLDFCADLRGLIESCKRVMEKSPSPVFIGLCPAISGSAYCSAKLYVMPGAREVKCLRCSNEWPRYEWRSLGAAISRADRCGRSVPPEVHSEG